MKLGKTLFCSALVAMSVNGAYASPWPVGANDEVSTVKYQPITIPVISNDTGDSLFINSVNTSSKNWGSVSINDDKTSVTFTSYASGDDEFWYVLEDSEGRKNAAKVIVNVSDSAWPTATTDTIDAENGLVVMIPVLANDIGEALTVTKSNEWTPNGGRTEVVENLVRYTPPRDFTGTDHFWYDFEDKYGRANSAKVTVEVTQNTETSIVSFCGANYASDGTAANTVLTDQAVIESTPQYLSLGQTSFEEQGGEIGNRRYYVEDSEVTGQSLWMEQIDVPATKLVDAEAGEALSLVGAYNEHVYFSKGLNLFAHDGETMTDLGNVFEGITDTVGEAPTFSVQSREINNALYIWAITTDTSAYTVYVKKWRISDGLDLDMLWIGKEVADFTDFVSEGDTDILNQMTETELTYFSGFEYSKQWRYNYWNTNNNEASLAVADLGEVLERRVLNASVWENTNIIENNNRLFVVQGKQLTGGTLYGVDPLDRSFSELASCSAIVH